MRVHQRRIPARRRTEAAIQVGVLGGQRAVQSRMEAAIPVSRQDELECRKPAPGRAKRAIVRIRPVHDPRCEFRMIHLVRNVVGQQAAGQKRLRRQRELSAAMRDRTRQPELLRNVPDELLQESNEPLVVEPDERHRLDAVLERFRIERDADLERFQRVVRPVKNQVLTTHLPLIEIVVAFDAIEHAIRIVRPRGVCRICA